jgi:hypothetical protein
MFHNVAYFEPLGKVWQLMHAPPEYANRLNIEKSTRVYRPTRTGVEPHTMEKKYAKCTGAAREPSHF